MNLSQFDVVGAKRKTTCISKTVQIYRPDISVVLGTFNRLSYLRLTLECLRDELRNISSEIIVIDGGSSDGTLKWLMEQKDIISIIQHNRGRWQGKEIERRSWGYFMNLGFKCAQGKYVVMISDDCLIVPGSIVNGIEYFDRCREQGTNVGALAFWWRNWPNDDRYFIVKTFGKIIVNHGMFLRKALEDVKFIDENNYRFYHADSDLALKIWQKGYVILPSNGSYIEHHMLANEKVRKSNEVTSIEDWTSLGKKWKKHPMLEKFKNRFLGRFSNNRLRNDIISKNYIDSCKTAERFNEV